MNHSDCNDVNTVPLALLGGVLHALNNFLWKDTPAMLSNAMFKLYGKKCEHLPSKRDAIAVVTSGEKFEDICLIKELAKLGYTVVVGHKDPKSSEILHEVIKNEKFLGRIDLSSLNMESLQSVEEFVKEFNVKYSELSLLVNNYDNFYDKYSPTADGLESNIAVNYTAHFYLIHLLLRNLKYTADYKPFYSRIVNITSPDVFGSRINFTDLNNKDNFSPRNAYGQSKIAMLMMTKYLNDRITYHHVPIRIHAVNSGRLHIAEVNWITRNPVTNWLMSFLKIKPSDIVNSMLYTCVSKDLEMFGGQYISNCRKDFIPLYAKNKNNQERLFKETCKILKINEFGAKCEHLLKFDSNAI